MKRVNTFGAQHLLESDNKRTEGGIELGADGEVFASADATVSASSPSKGLSYNTELRYGIE